MKKPSSIRQGKHASIGLKEFYALSFDERLAIEETWTSDDADRLIKEALVMALGNRIFDALTSPGIMHMSDYMDDRINRTLAVLGEETRQRWDDVWDHVAECEGCALCERQAAA